MNSFDFIGLSPYIRTALHPLLDALQVGFSKTRAVFIQPDVQRILGCNARLPRFIRENLLDPLNPRSIIFLL